MSTSLARVRDLSIEVGAKAAATLQPSLRTTTVYTAAGDPSEVPLLEIRCPRCLRVWEWPRGIDPELDRRADRGSAMAECPACLDHLAELRLADFPWEADG